MARIVGKDLPNNKPAFVGFTHIVGIGRASAYKICTSCGIDPHKRIGKLSEDELSRISQEIEATYLVEGQLRRAVTADIARLRKIGCYRGLRHAKGLPVRGQRTRTNARTRKGKRKTVAGKKSVKAMK